MYSIQTWGIFIVSMMFIIAPLAYAQPVDDFMSSQIIVIVGLELATNSIQNDDLNQAKKSVDITDDYYGRHESMIGQFILFGIYLTTSSYVLVVRPRKENQLVAMQKSRSDTNAE